MFAHAELVVFHEAGTYSDPHDSSGTVTGDWATATDVLTLRCAVSPITDEDVDAAKVRNPAIEQLTLYLAGLVDIDPRWRCTVRGRTYQVQGRSRQWKHPASGWQAGTTVVVEAVDG